MGTPSLRGFLLRPSTLMMFSPSGTRVKPLRLSATSMMRMASDLGTGWLMTMLIEPCTVLSGRTRLPVSNA